MLPALWLPENNNSPRTGSSDISSSNRMANVGRMARRIAFGFWSIAQSVADASAVRVCSALGFLRWNLCALFAGFREPNGDDLLSASHPATFARSSRTQCSMPPGALRYLLIFPQPSRIWASSPSWLTSKSPPKRYRDDVRSAMVTACKLRPKGRHQIHGSSLHDVPHCNRTHSQ
jgi:hypothetical protein